MSKKDFELIARTIRTLPISGDGRGITTGQRRVIAEHFAAELATTNPRFRTDVFIAACGAMDTSEVEKDLGL